MSSALSYSARLFDAFDRGWGGLSYAYGTFAPALEEREMKVQ